MSRPQCRGAANESYRIEDTAGNPGAARVRKAAKKRSNKADRRAGRRALQPD